MRRKRVFKTIIAILLIAFLIVLFNNPSFSLVTVNDNNTGFHVGYSIKDVSPQMDNYNVDEQADPNMPIVYDCNDSNAVVTAPINPLPLSGFGSEEIRATNKQCIDKDSHLTVSVVAIKDDSENYIIFVNADIVEFSASYTNGFTVNEIRNSSARYIKEQLGLDIPTNRIMLSATHTHSAIAHKFSTDKVKAYNIFYKRQLNEAIVEAIQDMKKGTATYGKFEVYLDENGDVVENGTTIPEFNKKRLSFMRHYTTDNYVFSNKEPVIRTDAHGLYGLKCTDSNFTNCSDTYSVTEVNGYAGAADYEMQIIKIAYDNSTVKPVLMVNWQAHPVIQGSPELAVITADYVGYFRNYLEKKGYRVAFYNGAAGDINPRTSLASDNFKVDNQNIVYNVSTNAQRKFAAFIVGERLGELADKRLKSTDIFNHTINPKNGIKFYQEENNSELGSNKILMYTKRWTDKDEQGNNLYNNTILYNAYFINTFNTIIENDILNGTDNFSAIVNGSYTIEKWKTSWNYKDENGNDIPFQFPLYFNEGGVNDPTTLSKKLIALLREHNTGLFSNKFIFKQMDGLYKLDGYSSGTYPLKSTMNNVLMLIGDELDDLSTTIDERIYSRMHASVLLGTYIRTTSSSNLELDTFSIGDLGFVTAPYEMFNSNGRFIKENSPFNETFVLGYTNGRYIYLPDKAAFEYKSYEADIATYVKGTAEINAETLVNRLKEIYDWSTNNWYDDYEYTLINNDIYLTKYNGNDEIVYVPGTATIGNITYQTIIHGAVYKGNKSIRYVRFDKGIKASTSIKELFMNCTNLIDVTLNDFDTRQTTDMSYMFKNCQNLTKLDLNKLDTSKVTTMEEMFCWCLKLTEMHLSNFDTSSVETMQSMFYGCKSLKSINIGSFDTSNVINYVSMFHLCISLEEINISNFNTSKATNMYRMFYECNNLKSIYIGDKWDISKVTISTEMFYNCTKLTGENGTVYDSSKTNKEYAQLDQLNNKGYLSNWLLNYIYIKDTSNKKIILTKYNGDEESIYVPAKIKIDIDNYDIVISGNVYENKTSIKYIYFEDGVKASTSLTNLFRGCTNVIEIQLNNFNTSLTENMSYMFYNCKKLKVLDISQLNTSKVTTMQEMFLNCQSLTKLLLSNFDTSNVKILQSMFYGCTNLAILDIRNFNTENVTKLTSMFQSCSSLETINLGSFNTSKVANMYRMFKDCTNLKTIYVDSEWDTSNTTTSTEMFYNCKKIEGGNGTIFDNSVVDKTYARIDKANNKGYLTDGSLLKEDDIITLSTKTATFTGSSIDANMATALSGMPVTYTYYDSINCTGNVLSDAPTNVGNYSVKATTKGNGYYKSGSKCVTHTIINKKATLIVDNSITVTDEIDRILLYEYDGDGTISCTSSDTTIVTCSVNTSAKKIIVHPVKIANTTITLTIKATAGKNYSSTDNITVNVSINTNQDLKDILINHNYRLSNNFVTGFSQNYSVDSLITKLNDSSIQIICLTDKIATGTIIKRGAESYTVVIKGDLTGDGKINSADLLTMRKYLLEEVNLTGAYKEAGIIESNNEIKSLDLLRLRQYLLGEYVFK